MPSDRGVYIVGEIDRSDRRLKVGMTTGLVRRLRDLSGGPGPVELLWWWDMPRTPVRTIVRRERELHERWSSQRLHGEWFRDAGELALFVRAPFSLGRRWCDGCGGVIGPTWLSESDTLCQTDERLTCDGAECGARASSTPLFRHRRNPALGKRCFPCWSSAAEAWREIPNNVAGRVLDMLYIGNLSELDVIGCSGWGGLPAAAHQSHLADLL